jgi:hypothetical protein
MGEWHEFFLAQAGAAGVLTGLVFVGVSINLEKILVEVLAVGLFAWGWVVAIQLQRLRDWGAMRPDLRGAFVLRVALGQIAALPLVIAGVTVLAGGAGRALLACGGHRLLDPRGFVRGVGVTRRDQPVGESED